MKTLKEEFKEIVAQFKNRNGETIADFERVTNDIISRFASEIKEVKQAVRCIGEDQFNFADKQLGSFAEYPFEYYAHRGKVYIALDGKAIMITKGLNDNNYQGLHFTDYLTQEGVRGSYNEFILNKVRCEYSKGTRIKSMLNGFTYISDGDFEWLSPDEINVKCGANSIHVFYNGKWAEKLTPLFKTEDGVDIYEGDKSVRVSKMDFIIEDPDLNNGVLVNEYWYFSTTKEAEKYVKEERERREEKAILDKAKADAYLGDILEEAVTDNESFMRVMRIFVDAYNKNISKPNKSRY